MPWLSQIIPYPRIINFSIVQSPAHPSYDPHRATIRWLHTAFDCRSGSIQSYLDLPLPPPPAASSRPLFSLVIRGLTIANLTATEGSRYIYISYFLEEFATSSILRVLASLVCGVTGLSVSQLGVNFKLHPCHLDI